MNISVVIGANYGDEGKGMVTNFLTHKIGYDRLKDNYIVLTNGGAQRGHTVETKDGFRHVFHHFGSTTKTDWYSYCPEYFIVNPAIWKQELDELESKGLSPTLYVDPSCMVSTPLDMLLNQMVERNREDNRHGSVGVGIWETIQRQKELPLTFNNKENLYDLKPKFIEYFYKKITEYNIKSWLIDDMIKDINLDNLFNHFIWDFYLMQNKCSMRTFSEIAKYANHIIFENGQGLLLDQSEDAIHATPSNTGSTNVVNLLQKYKIYVTCINPCYVTRSYLTRHGAGPMENEVKYTNEIINSSIGIDETNKINDYQGALRYGNLNTETLLERIKKDQELYKNISHHCFDTSIYVTHLNETENNFEPFINYQFKSFKHILYLSNDKYTFPLQIKRIKY